MQAPIEVSRRGVGEVFSLDILSHWMSAMGILRQISPAVCSDLLCADTLTMTLLPLDWCPSCDQMAPLCSQPGGMFIAKSAGSCADR
jgi:hypothetical protein